MRKRNLSVTLWSIVRVILGLLLCLQQGYASDQREEEETLQPQRFLEIKASYGDFDVLSEDILFHQLLPRCGHNIIKVNRSFFTLVTGYESDHIFDQGFKSKPTKPICCLRGRTVFNFKKHRHNIKRTPSFVWSLIREVRDIPSSYWFYLKGSQIHTMDLSYNRIKANGARDLGQYLKGTQVQNIKLSWSQIGDEDARAFGQCLQGTQVHTVDLSFNRIGDDGAWDFGQSLQGTQVHTVNLSNNQIGDDGARDLAQALKETHVQKINLSYNNITKDMRAMLKQLLPGIILTFENDLFF